MSDASPGSHPYFRYQSSFLSLMKTDAGGILYSSMLEFVQLFELRHPQAMYMKKNIPTSLSFLDSNPSPYKPRNIPCELLELVFAWLSPSDLLRLCMVSQDWCVSSSRFMHTAIRFRMRGNWQAEFNTPEKREEAEAYAFASELILLYGASKRRFAGWIRGVSYNNWPCFISPSFYRLLPLVQTVSFVGSHCSVHNYPIIRFPYILPHTITSITIECCSLRGNSVEVLIAMCGELSSLILCSVFFGHIVRLLSLSMSHVRLLVHFVWS